ncbi:MAG: hypothetical protein KKG33_13910 [candidate division Zixibacteria bacterium]|nr:hypothetical protein [candidate division Zixibacteria bacterium]MBU1469833.1 hypothetical protein [candidate division Zixibacteria bacterium]MBU2626648.1 hypothetical protein [candidate division Zixibacteria bacterium]
MMSTMQPSRTFALIVLAILLLTSGSTLADDKVPGKILFENVYFPQLIESGQKVAYFKAIIKDSTSISRLCIGDLKTGKETILFKDIDFNIDKTQAFCITPDNKYAALVDKRLTMCDIWLHDLSDEYAEPIRVTNLEKFDPGYSADDVMAMGMNPKNVLDVRQLDISPDGKKYAYTFGVLGKSAVWMYEIDRDHYRQMTPDRQGYLPKWFPDSERFVYVKGDSLSGVWSEDMFIMDVRTNKSTPLVASEKSEGWATPSRDGKYVAYLENSEGVWNPCVVRVSDGKTIRLVTLPFGKSCGSAIWSGDGTSVYVVMSGFDEAFSYLVELPFDSKMLD